MYIIPFLYHHLVMNCTTSSHFIPPFGYALYYIQSLYTTFWLRIVLYLVTFQLFIVLFLVTFYQLLVMHCTMSSHFLPPFGYALYYVQSLSTTFWSCIVQFLVTFCASVGGRLLVVYRTDVGDIHRQPCCFTHRNLSKNQ